MRGLRREGWRHARRLAAAQRVAVAAAGVPGQEGGDLLPLELRLRYERAVEGSLYRALHELQRVQAARVGTAVSPPAVVDVTGLER